MIQNASLTHSPYRYIEGIASVDIDSEQILLPIKDKISSILWMFGAADESNEWIVPDNANWTQGWYWADPYTAILSGMKGYPHTAYAVTYLAGNGSFAYYQSGTAFTISNDTESVTVKCTRGNLFKAGVPYRFHIIYLPEE